MTVLVTGAAGFLGRHLCRSVLAEGETVVGVDNFITSDPLDLLDLRAEPRFTFWEMDCGDPGFLEAASDQRLDAIYHLACPTGVPNLGPLALEMLNTCFRGSTAVLELARSNRVPVLFTSTAEVYGNPQEVPQAESYSGNVDTLGPRKGYEEGKRVGETLFGIYAERYGVEAKIARVFNTYGPGMSLNDTRVVPAFVKAALLGAPLVVYGRGLQTRCHVYASDMIEGLRRVMRLGEPARAYNLGSQKSLDVLTLAETVLALVGSGSGFIEYQERPAHDHDRRVPDTARARTELGWAPTVALTEGLEATIAEFRHRLAATGQIDTVKSRRPLKRGATKMSIPAGSR